MNFVKYNRTFVMMEEQTKDFSAKEAPVKGYLKVETGNNKGALRCVVQNLKYYTRGEYIYKLIFFGKKHGMTIHTVLGSLIVNRSGNGETYFRFNPLDMDGKGNSYDDFTIAIVAAASGTNDKEALHPVLKGVTRNEISSFRQEERITDDRKDNSAEEKVRLKEYRKYEEEKFRQLREKEEKDKIIYEKQKRTKDFCSEVEKAEAADSIREEKEELINILKKEAEKSAKHEKIAPQKDKPRAVYNSFYNDYLLQFCGYTCKVAGYYEEVMPFENDLTGARWKKIQNVASLPLVSPGAHYFATQYRHYLFGAKPDPNGLAEEYLFAIPGRFTQEEQPDGGRSGFVFWQPVVGAPKDKSSYGYWIVAVDARTGDILEVAQNTHN